MLYQNLILNIFQTQMLYIYYQARNRNLVLLVVCSLLLVPDPFDAFLSDA